MPLQFDPNNPYGSPELPFHMTDDDRWKINNQTNEAPYLGQEQQLANGMNNPDLMNPNNSVSQQMWLNQGLGNQWSAEAMGQQQQAYDLAKSYANGAATPAQRQLAQSQQTGNALGIGSALGAGGGARGAAAARGALQDQAGAQTDMQRATMAQQKAADQAQYTAEASKLGNQLYQSQLGYAQGDAAWQNAQAQLKGQYQQLGDQASLGAGSMLENVLSQNLGLGAGMAQQNLQQYEQQQQMNQQMFGAAVNATGAGFGQAGRSMGGGGGGQDNGPYGLGNNPDNPWWNS